MKRWFGIALLVGSCLWASPANAQQEEETERVNVLEKGRSSLTFRIPDAGIGAIGLWHMFSDRTNFGVVFDLKVLSTNSDEAGATRTEANHWFAVQPTVAYYLHTKGSVAPFLFAGVFGNYQRTHSHESNTRSELTGWAVHGGISGGGGVEWFPVPEVSVGGRAGAQLGVSRGVEDAGNRRGDSSIFFNTFTTNLVLRFYFP